MQNQQVESELTLSFTRSPQLTLERTKFRTAELDHALWGFRSKAPLGFPYAAVFDWYRGPQALTSFFLRAASYQESTKPTASGPVGSIASCLDMLITKTPIWMYDAFGADENGSPTILKLLRRKNVGRRSGLEVTITLNEALLCRHNIHIYVDGQRVSDSREMNQLAAEVEAQWRASKTAQGQKLADRGSRVAKEITNRSPLPDNVSYKALKILTKTERRTGL